jgi:hypothetical protein
MIMEIRLGDTVRLRKAHPCGGYDWEVYRLGADIGVRCLTCGRRVLLARSVFEKRVKTFLSRGPEAMETDTGG